MNGLQTRESLANRSAVKSLRVVHMTSVHSATDPRIFHKECRSLARAGFEVTVVGPCPRDTVVDAVRLKPVVAGKSRLARMTRTAWSVYSEARKENADLYHFHDPELIPFGLLLSAGGKLVVYDIHEDLPKDILSKHYLPGWLRPVISFIVKRFESFASSRFSGLVAVTPAIAQRFREINKNLVVVHNFPYSEELVCGAEFVPWQERRRSVAYVGGITVQRAIREMVSAMALLPESLDATLELAGPENADEADSEAIREDPGWKRVRHHGFLDQPSTFQLLRASRAGLVLFHPEPNHLESMPQKIFEYMGAGLPVIASDFPLWRQIIGQAGCGIFVDPTSPREIAQAIEHVLSNPTEAEEMGRRGQAAVLEKFNWNSEASKLVQLYQQLAGSPCAA